MAGYHLTLHVSGNIYPVVLKARGNYTIVQLSRFSSQAINRLL